jgi:hypothetical protein
MPNEKLIGIPVDEYIAPEADPSLHGKAKIDSTPCVDRPLQNPSMEEGEEHQRNEVLGQLP